MRATGAFQEIPLEDGSLKKLEELLTGLSSWPCNNMLNMCKLVLGGGLPANVVETRFYKFVDTTSTISTGDFIVCIQKPNHCAKTGVIILPPSSPTTGMISAFENLIKWTTEIVFQSCPVDFWESHLSPLCTRHSGHSSGRNVKFGLWVLDKNTSLELDIPSSPTFELHSLEEKHVPQMMANWHYSKPHSEEHISKVLRFLPSCGLFAKTRGDNEELASSMLVSALGLFNILYTEENHRGKGYAQLVIQWLAKHAAKEFGLNCLIETEPGNKAIACLKRIGFRQIRFVHWYWYEPREVGN